MLFKKWAASLFVVALLAGPTSQAANSYGIRANPLGLLLGLVNLEFDAAFGNWVVTPGFTTWGLESSGYDFSLNGFSLVGSYHFSGALVDSWYIGGGFNSLSVKASDASSEGTASLSGVVLRGGYLWVWDSFYMNLGATVLTGGSMKVEVKNKTSGTLTDETSLPSFGAGFDWKIGFSF
jgi:hypothetical protein